MSDNMLSDKKQRFCLEFIVDYSAPDAAERAGYPRTTGSKLLKDPAVKKRIEDEVSRVRTQKHVTIERCVDEYAKLAFSDISDAVDWGTDEQEYNIKDEDGNTTGTYIRRTNFIELIDVEELPANVRACIKSVKMTANGPAIEFYDKKAALDSIMKHLGGFAPDKVEVGAGGELAALLNAATDQGHRLPSEIHSDD